MLLSVRFFGVAELTTICCTTPSPERCGQLSELRQGLETAGLEQTRELRGRKGRHAKAASFAWTEAAIIGQSSQRSVGGEAGGGEAVTRHFYEIRPHPARPEMGTQTHYLP